MHATDSAPPLVSVLVTCFNEEKYIKECILSIKSQTYSNIELIIIDDASTDGTVKAINDCISEGDNLIINSSNQKIELCFNRLLEIATGKYIKIVMADDVLMPSSIERSVALLEKEAGVSLFAHGRRIIDHRSRKLFDLQISRKSFRSPGRQMFLRALKSGQNIIGEPNACLFRREHLTHKNFWDLSIPAAGELFLWFKILDQGDFYYDPDPLCGFRISPKSATFIHSTKVAKQFRKFLSRLQELGLHIPLHVRLFGILNSRIKQELRRLVYLWIMILIKIEDNSSNIR